jgi:GntR family transcriptional regulator of arabinose operon
MSSQATATSRAKRPRRAAALLAADAGAAAATMHQRVRLSLAQKIAQGEYALGAMIPSESELCRQFGVSRITVRQALAALVAEGLLVKQPGRGTFVSQPSASAAGADNKVIGLVVTNAVGTFMSQLIMGAERVAREHGYSVSIAIAHDDPARERQCIQDLIGRRVAGALLMPVDSGGPANPNCFDYLRIRDAGIPLLFVDRYLSQLPVGYVVGPDQDGMNRLTQHMIDQGYRDIGYIHHDIAASSVAERYQGYLSAILSHRLHPGLLLTASAPSGDHAERNDFDRGRVLVERLLAGGGKPPRALIGCNSLFAIGAMHALTAAGYRVPQDVAVAGFDDLPECQVLSVPMTVLRVPIEGMGAKAVQRLIEMIESESRDEPVRERLPGELVVRSSCGGTPGSTVASGVAVQTGVRGPALI